MAAQQSATFMGTSSLTADYATIGAPDALDQWAMQREQQERQQASLGQQYLSPEMVGADDLGSDGTWEDTPDWGYAWFPTVDVGWAPYTDGDWVWVSPWGWTWDDAEPWGFAPFHYGRWGHWKNRWCWIPGPPQKRPVYAPALVGWVGGRNVGWFPLGPRDVYVPGYHASLAYVRMINLTNSRLVDTTVIASVYAGHVTNLRYANSEVPGGVTMVSRDVFTSAQFVGRHRVALPQQGVAGLPVTTAAPAIAPLQQSVFGTNSGRAAREPPRAIVDRPVVARLVPPRAPVSFVTEQAAIQANGGRPLPLSQLARMRTNTPAVPVRLEAPPKYYYYHAPPGADIAARERNSQRPTPPQAQAFRNDREPSAQGQAASGRRFSSPQRQVPQRYSAPHERHAASQHEETRSSTPRAAPTSTPDRAPERRPPARGANAAP